MLINIDNKIINTAHVIDADFIRAQSGIDEETEQPFSRAADLKITFSVTETEIKTDFDGDFLAVEHAPYFRRFQGRQAEIVWDWLVSQCALAARIPGKEATENEAIS